MAKSYKDFCCLCDSISSNVCQECEFNPMLMVYPSNYIPRDGLTWNGRTEKTNEKGGQAIRDSDYVINKNGHYKWKVCETCMSFNENFWTGEHCSVCKYPPDISTGETPIRTKPTNYAPVVLNRYPETTFDSVSHPSHYTEGRQYEPRKVIHDWGLNFNLGNAVKYISRAGRKGDALEDLKKARQYLDFEIEEMEKEDK